ncbi:hypothetical protein PYV61_25910, partial [Roseisolibacter sp. H3M3-2]
VDPARLEGARATEWVAEAPSGRRTRLGAGQAASVLSLDEAGVFRVRAAGAPAGTGVPLAANADPAESDPARVEPAELSRAVTVEGGAPAAAAAPAETRVEREARQGFWWWFLAGVLCLLAAETLLSNRRAPLAR